MYDKIIHLYKHNFSHNSVRDKPLIHKGRSRSNKELRHGREENDIRGDVLSEGLWERPTDSITDFIFRDENCNTYKKEPMINLLALWKN